jgi:hypothetical protein
MALAVHEAPERRVIAMQNGVGLCLIPSHGQRSRSGEGDIACQVSATDLPISRWIREKNYLPHLSLGCGFGKPKAFDTTASILAKVLTWGPTVFISDAATSFREGLGSFDK